MPRAVAHYPSREMAILGLVELTLSFAAIYVAIQAAGASMPLPAVAEILPSGGVALAAILTLISGGVALIIGLYRPEVCLEGKRLLTAGGLAAIITLTVLFFVDGWPHRGHRDGNAVHTAETIVAWLAAMALIRRAYGIVTGHRSMGRLVLLLGDPAQVGALSAHLLSRRGRLFDPIVHQGQTMSWSSLRQRDIWGVVVASQPEEATIEALLDCKFRGMRISSAAAFREKYLGRIDLDALTANDLLLGQDFLAGKRSAGLKRLCDIVVGGCMLVLLLPLMALTALAIKIDSPGPVFYRQRRVGRVDTTFTLFKFRSMTADAEANGRPLWAQKQDPRVTRVGRVIRATRIDELPQLANILRGEMSLVGPRPERPHFVKQLARAIPLYRQRTYVKPGLTGWAQVNFPYGASVEDAREKLAFDLYYVKNRTIVLDMIILISTIRVVLFREGAR
ncbi:exopolysaccharide biosynthesis polyprenyl glycosylphosphotransferase [Acidisphaera sp. S103]|uniref:exopolysaccharide biosynthesis polyprenyl glycosylphosphotransferase n=1 Tax=Acidisphaera sp. S103 TaxID=1747223 RepID=UPI00131AE45D|nr:exopolysaccharide biosynthesis polyprenyl glycosylphosphotransferase [Acidisphaera sp. S103]